MSSSQSEIIVERLSSQQDRSNFDCGVDELNSYLQRYSSQHERKGIGRTYVAVKRSEMRVLGYYTIWSSAVAFDTVPENLPRHPVPVALVGRLAVDNTVRGEKLGETLLIHALRSAQRAARIVGIYAVVVEALDYSAKSFYLKYGFQQLTDDHLHLYLPMKVIEKLNL
jgi:predicted GNAT family N-acyltransferase